MPESSVPGDSVDAEDIFEHDLPLQLHKSEIIPPAPNPTGSAIDFIPDFAGYGWLGYGAASLFVITHFPSPASPCETVVGPIMRQVFELDGYVNAVAWSPVTPSIGDVAVASENRIFLYSHDAECTEGPFGWSQNAMLVQDTKVEVVNWTGSGDGIVAGGVEVVLWKNKNLSWEVVWKFRNELPQDLVSTTWSIEGPLATVASYRGVTDESSAASNNGRKCVSVCQSNEKFDYLKLELHHPEPITMIQWRPLQKRNLDQGFRQSMRNVLMTSSVDGTVRLWCEIDSGKVGKFGKDGNHQQALKKSFCVAAVIEINNVLTGTLGSNLFVVWATESHGVVRTPGGSVCIPTYSFEDSSDNSCEWIVGIGPGMMLTLWAIHCLDAVAPVRFPRVTLWHRQEVPGIDLVSYSTSMDSRSINHSPFTKVFFSRAKLSAPPTFLSMVNLVSGNSVRWSMLHNGGPNGEKSSITVNDKSDILLGQAHSILEITGHSGRIVDVAVHPDHLNHQYAISLDSKGKALIWSLSTNIQTGMPKMSSSWKVCGKLFLGSSSPRYTRVLWAPTVLMENFMVLMGHAGGIDCYVVRFLSDEFEGVACNHMCTIPLHVHHAAGPTCISAVPLTSTSSQNFSNSEFMLIGVWIDNFEALSWEVTFHSSSSESSCGCESQNVDKSESLMRFEHTLLGKKYCVLIHPRASQWPQLHTFDKITSVATLCTSSLNYSLQMKHYSVNDARYSVYHMATGNSDGIVKLWSSNFAKSLSLTCQWELVGTFSFDTNPISALSFTDCGTKIATITTLCDSNTSVLRIWECIHLLRSGSVIIEDTITFDGHVVALKWLTSGSGQLLLGVCLPNKVQLLTQRRCGGQSLLGSQTKLQIWCCLATTQISPPVNGFLWAPGATPLLVHDYYFGSLEQWLCNMVEEHRTTRHHSFFIAGEPSTSAIIKKNYMECPEEINAHTKPDMKLRSRSSIVELADKLIRPLPAYHPESLIANILSGNWKRARFALRFLIENFTERENSKMKSASPAPQILLSDYFEGHELDRSTVMELPQSVNGGSSSKVQLGFSAFAFGSEYDTSHTSTSSPDTELCEFNKLMEKLHARRYVSNIAKLQTCAIMDVLNEIDSSQPTSVYGSLDESGQRFWVAVRFQMMLFRQRTGQFPSTEDVKIDSRLICWAFHSDCQENLFGSLLPNEPSWSDMRAIGFGFWFTDATQLRTKMEKLARLQYLKNRDPKACALLYIALNRIQVLAGLFKISRDEKDKPLVGFLCRNFQEEKNKAAALKNAYVLMGRHQLELAIAFFLLGGDMSSAITVCAKNLGDEQLALVICRLIEGHGGPIKKNLVSSYLLPNAIEKSDYWLQSLFQWEIGNYSQSFLAMLGTQGDSKAIITSSSTSFLDPSIGQYCMLLSTKTCVKNALGEEKAAVLSKWATLMFAISLNRCGLSLEALETMSSSSNGIAWGKETEKSFDSEYFNHNVLQLPIPDISNWLSGSISCHLESQTKLQLALKYFSNLIKEHPNWPEKYLASGRARIPNENDFCQYERSLEAFSHKLHSGLRMIEQKFAICPSPLVDTMIFFLCNNRLFFMAHTVLFDNVSEKHSENLVKLLPAYPSLQRLLVKSVKELYVMVSRFTFSCCMNCSQTRASVIRSQSSYEVASLQPNSWCFYMQDVLQALWTFKSSWQVFLGSDTKEFTLLPFLGLDFLEYLIYFAVAWMQKNVKGLILLVQNFLISCNKHVPYEVSKRNLDALRADISQVLLNHSPTYEDEDLKFTIPLNERWKIIGACLWRQISLYMRHQLDTMSMKTDNPSSASDDPTQSELAGDSAENLMELISNITKPLLASILEHFSSYHSRLLGSLLLHKLNSEQGLSAIDWLQKCIQSQSEAFKCLESDTPPLGGEDKLWDISKLWDILVDLKIILEGFAQENINLLQVNSKALKRWSSIYKDIQMLFEKEASSTQENDLVISPTSSEPVLSGGGFFRNGPSFFGSRRRNMTPKEEFLLFEKPKEIYKKNGELFEAVCVNSIDQNQAALASNKKGILFFQWDGSPVVDQSDYIWSEVDWPRHRWDGLISDHYDASIGSDKVKEEAGGGSFSAKFGRDMRHDKGYHMGWDAEDHLIDPPATVNNTISRTFSCHPSRPFFLVGSANTHIYLWEFGKDRATATYGVLPAASVPPPYAIPSISAVEFDACGHRFSTAALNGTVSTWQLEVGGRRNILPTESLPCFDGYSSDITYIPASGSIVAASGYGSDGFNAVIWDTLAPPSTSRASIRCHEGGAHSIAVFDNGIGGGSVSPLIVTGGKDGDIGLHDFRYVATGKMKRNKTFSSTELDPNSGTNSPTKSHGEPNTAGMLWYIPKAHIGSVTKIAAIPNSSLFLTGSKDGDVKLWDAQKSRLVYHWQRLHERHTFLQPSTRGYSGVVQAGVTDIKVMTHGFITCGGDGSVKFTQLKDLTRLH